MEYTNNISPLEFTMSCIVCIGYISGKLWMYYRIDSKDTKPNKKKPTKGAIKRGHEWD